MNSGIIYAYKRIDINKIIYVGQTTQLKTRHKHHFTYDPYNDKTKEYNYPLSKAIRKYGKDIFELIILEKNILKEELNNKEKYYINFYNTYFNGYNQNTGGKDYGKSFCLYSQEIIQEIINMLKENKSFLEINNKTKVSLPHISNINTGERCKQDNLIYPIKNNHCGGKLFDNEVIEIINLLLNTTLTQSEIGKIYKVKQTIISKINLGKRKSILNYKDYSFPLRKGRCYDKV